MAIFRRFGTMNVQNDECPERSMSRTINVQNLLFLQAELSHLEYELRRLQE
jgi:hypothetical protein